MRPCRGRQLVLIEIALAVVLVAWTIHPLLSAPAGAVAVSLVLPALVRKRQCSLPEWPATVFALRRRLRGANSWTVPDGTQPELAPAVECDPALRTYSYSHRDRRPVGLIGDGTFLTAVLRIESEGTALRPDRCAGPLPVSLVAQALHVDGIRLESAQIVQHTFPGPASGLPARSVAARNYTPLRERSGSPAVRITWIALKLDPERCREAVTARGGALPGAQKCVVRIADHLASRLTGTGFRVTVLTEQELTAAITLSCGANPPAGADGDRTGTPARRTRESVRSWRCDDRSHTTYWVARWPRPGADGASVPKLVALLTSVPALATVFSLTLRQGDRQGVTVSGHLRVIGRDEAELTAARQELERTARGVRTGLVRLDHEQLPGMLATLPLGGTR